MPVSGWNCRPSEAFGTRRRVDRIAATLQSGSVTLNGLPLRAGAPRTLYHNDIITLTSVAVPDRTDGTQSVSITYEDFKRPAPAGASEVCHARCHAQDPRSRLASAAQLRAYGRNVLLERARAFRQWVARPRSWVPPARPLYRSPAWRPERLETLLSKMLQVSTTSKPSACSRSVRGASPLQAERRSATDRDGAERSC
jgi:hypothetical protein